MPDNSQRLAYGEMRDKLTPDDVAGKAAALRILSADIRDFAPKSSRSADNKIVLVFVEFPDKEYIVNATSYKTLVMKLGDDVTRWPGQWCVMAPTTTTYEGRAFEKLHVAPPERWDKIMSKVRDSERGSGVTATGNRKR